MLGFSRTRGLEGLEELFLEAFFEAWRMVWEAVDGAERRARHIVPPRGSRNRGIGAARDILSDLESESLGDISSQAST